MRFHNYEPDGRRAVPAVARHVLEDLAELPGVLADVPAEEIIYVWVEPFGGLLARWRKACRRPAQLKEKGPWAK